jgi:hypothetical protein
MYKEYSFSYYQDKEIFPAQKVSFYFIFILFTNTAIFLWERAHPQKFLCSNIKIMTEHLTMTLKV